MSIKKRNGMLLVLFLLILIMACGLLWHDFAALLNSPEKVRDLGWFGSVVLMGAVFLQVVLAFLPGEMLEVMAGILYGPWWGLFICLMGSTFASCLIYGLVKKWGEPLIKMFFSDDKIKEARFLKNEQHLFSVLFVIFLIPGTPKDLLTYLMPLTPLSKKQFLLIVSCARVPSIITSTLGGGLMAEQKYVLALIVFLGTAASALIGLRYYQLQTAKNVNPETRHDQS